MHDIASGAPSPYGETRWFVATLTLLPLLRIGALAIGEGLRGLAAPLPSVAAFGFLAAFAWSDDAGFAWLLLEYAGIAAGGLAGVVAGKGLAVTLGIDAPRSKTAELAGLFAAACVAAAMLAVLGRIRLAGGWGGPLIPFVAGAITTAVVSAIEGTKSHTRRYPLNRLK